jgi:hypothetical protein
VTAPTPCQKCKADLAAARKRVAELEAQVFRERAETEDRVLRAEQKLAAANALLIEVGATNLLLRTATRLHERVKAYLSGLDAKCLANAQSYDAVVAERDEAIAGNNELQHLVKHWQDADPTGHALDAANRETRAAKALLARIVKYATEDRASTPGTTRLARVLSEAEAYLSGQPAQPVPFTTVQGETFTHCTMPEREVLKAMYAVPTTELMTYAKVPFPGAPSPALREACTAELARRATEGQTTRDT